MGISPEMDNTVLQYRRQLILSEISTEKVNAGYQEYLVAREKNPKGIDNSSTNQKYLSREIEESTPEGATPEEQNYVRAIKIQEAGYVDSEWEQLFSTAPRNDKSLSKTAQIWGPLMLTGGMSNAIDTTTDEETQTVLTNTWVKIDKSGIEPIIAAQEAIAMGNLWKSDKESMKAKSDYYGGRNLAGKSRGMKAATKAFKSFVDDEFDKNPWIKSFVFGDPGQAEFSTEGLNREAIAYYENYFYDSYMRTDGDMEVAARDANLKFAQNFKMNNINGDWQIEKGGLEGDSEFYRTDYLNENKNEEVLYGEGHLRKGPMTEIGKVTFQRPFKAAGNLVYEVWGEQGPLMQDIESTTADGRKVVSREIVISRISGEVASEQEMKEIRDQSDKRIAKLEKELEQSERAIEEGTVAIYASESDEQIVRERPKQIEAEKQRTEKLEKESKRKYGIK
jgi:hypothetical protein